VYLPFTGVVTTVGLNILGLSEVSGGVRRDRGFYQLIPFVGPFLKTTPLLSRYRWVALPGWVFLLLVAIVQN
jgi:hypothetical protein